ncbi:cytosol aminopeptidase [Trichuris trichiura]|uniref:Cytosol aminopeptidase n=1 Tax=Trichuris trichiura TaxID=36087 RepID=A0A077Z3I7_TRITR|nr:cytosol aminopeptidase [Trichuris trichiura]
MDKPRCFKRIGVVIGIFEPSKERTAEVGQFTAAGQRFNEKVAGKLLSLLNKSEELKEGKCRILYDVGEGFNAVGVVCLGKSGEGYVNSEEIHQGRENVRRAVAAGVVALREVGMKEIHVDPCGYADAAAEGAFLSTFAFDELKSKVEDRKPVVDIRLYSEGKTADMESLWKRGYILASCQNLVRRLSDMPANLMTPVRFAEVTKCTLKEFSNVEVITHDNEWALEKKMGAFLSVGKGSDEPPVFLEIRLKAKKASRAPVCLVGKGVCFDSGGISLKPSASMGLMRFDMTGAACVLGCVYALAILHNDLPFDVIGLMPMVENMPSGKANKPGDVVFAMNGKSIEIENTDAEGRLILADALCYADTFQPSHVIDIATLTGAMKVALGYGVTGVFSNCDELWKKMHEAGMQTGDRVWRMPLFKHYSECVKLESVDVSNTSKPAFAGAAGACTAAAFLKEFTECKSWMHVDIAGVTENKCSQPLFNSSMTGRPLRTLVQCLENL